MFSARLPPLHENRISRATDEARAARLRGGAALIDLTETNPTAVGLHYPGGEILSAIADARTLEYRPSPRGQLEARAAVAGYYAERGATVDPDRIWLTASTSESYSFLFKLLCNPGEKVLVPRPSYPLFEHLSLLEGVRAEPYTLRYHSGWYLDLAEIRAKLDRDTRAVLLVNPNNPTGNFLKQEELKELCALLAARDVALISDEVFADFPLRSDPTRVSTLAGNESVLSFVLSGLSKPAGLPQIKLGWICASGPHKILRQAEERLDLIADTYLSVSTAAQHAAPRLLELIGDVGAQILERVRHNRGVVRSLVRDSAVQLLEAEGGWSAILRLPRLMTEEEWTLQFLAKDGVIVHPGHFFDLEEEAYLVVSLLPPESELSDGVRRIVARVAAVTAQ